MTKQEVIENGFETEIAAEIEVNEFEVIILDLASLDDDGWQVRESYVSKKGENDFIQFTHGDGYNGWNIAEQCGYPTAKRTAEISKHLGLDEGALNDLAQEIDDTEHLNSTDWSILERLQEDAQA